MKKHLILLVPLVVAVFLSAGFCIAQTYLYHDTVTESDSGSLTGTVATDAAVYLQMSLNVSNLEQAAKP